MIPRTAEAEYEQATVWLGQVWAELYQVDPPSLRAELLDRAAMLQEQRARLILAVYDPELAEFKGADVWTHLQGLVESAAVLRRVAATERALLGELEFPPVPPASRIAGAPDVVLLWVDLAGTDDRADRAGLLLKLADVLASAIGETAAETLATIAETEVRLAAEFGFAQHEIDTCGETPCRLTPAELAAAHPVQGTYVGACLLAGAPRSQVLRRGVGWRTRIAAIWFVAGMAIGLPGVLHWPHRDQLVVSVVAVVMAGLVSVAALSRGPMSVGRRP